MHHLVHLLIALLLSAHALFAHAQPGGVTAPREAAQFDFLIGQWEIELAPKANGLAAMVHGSSKLLGTWKAWRAFDGFGVEDELRVIDGSGNPATLAHAQRIFDAKTKRWLINSLDVYRARFNSGTAQWQDGEMRVIGNASGSATTPDGKPLLTRSRFFDITPERFRMTQDRSLDEGKSWEEGVLTVSAKRVAAKAVR